MTSGEPTTAIPHAEDPSGRARAASASGTVPTFHHANLKTARLPELIDWYGKVAGLIPNFRWDAGCFMTNDAANHRLAIFAGPEFLDDPDRRHRAGLHHLAFEFDSISALLDHYAALHDAGIDPAYGLNHGLTLSFYYRDPDDNHVELQADNYCDWAESTEFMRTSERFSANPVGELVDIAALYAAKQEGISDSELGRRSYEGEYASTQEPDFLMPE